MHMLAIAFQIAASTAPNCTGQEHRQLDFWVGRWIVTDTKTGQPGGRSLVEPIFKGCALRETFESPDGFEGGSTNLWDRATGEWVQFGTGSTGARMYFAGEWDGEKMQLSTTLPRAGQPLVIRMYLQPLRDTGVRQWSESSRDGGATWLPRYDYTYSPEPEVARQ